MAVTSMEFKPGIFGFEEEASQKRHRRERHQRNEPAGQAGVPIVCVCRSKSAARTTGLDRNSINFVPLGVDMFLGEPLG